jgi:hypothetical protein
MKNVLFASVVMGAGVCGGMATVAAAEQTVTIAPALRAGDVARSNVLTTMSMDFPETDDGLMNSIMQDTLLTASQEVTWTVQRVEPTYSVIHQNFSNTRTATSQASTMMARMMLLHYEGMSGPLECRVSGSGEVEDVLNGGEVAERAGATLKKMEPAIRESMKQATSAIHKDDREIIDLMFQQTFDSPAMRERLATMQIGKPLFTAAWLWGKTLTVGTPVTVPVSRNELLMGQEVAGASMTEDRQVTLVSANEHDLHVKWTMNATFKLPPSERPKIDMSTWPEDLRKKHERSLSLTTALSETQRYTETGEIRLDRRTGMPLDGSIIMRGGNGAVSMQMVVIYSPVSTVKTGD